MHCFIPGLIERCTNVCEFGGILELIFEEYCVMDNEMTVTSNQVIQHFWRALWLLLYVLCHLCMFVLNVTSSSEGSSILYGDLFSDYVQVVFVIFRVSIYVLEHNARNISASFVYTLFETV